MKKPNPTRFPGLARPTTTEAPEPNLYGRIGQRIAQAREARRLKQDELGGLVGESAVTISRWENALRKPNVEDLQKLAEVLETDLLYFTAETPPPDDAIRRLHRVAGKLPEDDREELVAIAKLKLQRKSKERLEQQLKVADH